jgi:hypothetical protein
MTQARITIAGLALLSSLGLATGAAFADALIIHTNPPPPPAKVVVVPKPRPVQTVVREVTKPDCDTTIKKVEGSRQTTTMVKKDCD